MLMTPFSLLVEPNLKADDEEASTFNQKRIGHLIFKLEEDLALANAQAAQRRVWLGLTSLEIQRALALTVMDKFRLLVWLGRGLR